MLIKSNLFLLFLVIIAPLRTIEVFAVAGFNLVVGDLIVIWVAFTTFIFYYYQSFYCSTKSIFIGKFCRNLFLIIVVGIPLSILHIQGKSPDLIKLTLPLELRYLSTIAFGVLVYLNSFNIKKFNNKSILNYTVILAIMDVFLSTLFARFGENEGARISSFLSLNGTAFFIPIAICTTAFSSLFSKRYRLVYFFTSIFLFSYFVISGSRTPFVGFLFSGIFIIFYLNKIFRHGGSRGSRFDLLLIIYTFVILFIGTFLLLITVHPTSIVARSIYNVSGIIGYFSTENNNTFFFIKIWQGMISVILQNPFNILFGRGMNTLYAERSLGYVNDDLTRILHTYHFHGGHNAYVELFTGGGILSLILYVRILFLTLNYIQDFSSLNIPYTHKYLIVAIGSYSFGHVVFESIFHPLSNGHSNFYIFIFIASSLCAVIDNFKRGGTVII
ncbi:hypothetical protein [Lyngbya aestuarii]|uniref:hypothetical protein n=1 Tax=Lyngbya aestuarii TaxID=118322 RepID=UPI00403DE129